METAQIEKLIHTLAARKTDEFYNNDFLLTWDHDDDQIAALFETAEILRALRKSNIS